ncbi:MAG TPA: HepT-like ribonuclease domain-containing protein [Sulfurimonas sp.]|uniref:HepT-like ribonuclease domain-containing protein n=1 Tax=Sulfurimonas sp. TaxID=2022749 RepID=UPI002C303DC6|nr:HepT-like ribonuclease domain-containing protein [Sulfurimonas sp.]HUH41513.1 HepT-like ribonuclease domain-containing protein [Sulfurimonas sp.]
MSSGINRLQRIYECIEDIEFILNTQDLKITHAIQDKIIKPAVRMNIVIIAEQFAKLKDDNRFQILENFTSEDLKGISSVRNYIAHDYDSTDNNIIEDVVRYNLPVFKEIIKELLKN